MGEGSLKPSILVSIDVDPRAIRDMASWFHDQMLERVRGRGWEDFSRRFWRAGSIDFDHLENLVEINSDVGAHPLLRWVLERRGRG